MLGKVKQISAAQYPLLAGYSLDLEYEAWVRLASPPKSENRIPLPSPHKQCFLRLPEMNQSLKRSKELFKY